MGKRVEGSQGPLPREVLDGVKRYLIDLEKVEKILCSGKKRVKPTMVSMDWIDGLRGGGGRGMGTSGVWK